MGRPFVFMALVLLTESRADTCTIKQNMDCDGSDLPNGRIGVVKDVAACCSACQANPACKAFTKHGPKDTGSPNACLLKSNCMGAQIADGSVGGVTSGSIPPVFDCKQGHKGPSPTPASRPLPRVRPPANSRTFTSPELEKQLGMLVNNKTWHNPELATLLWNCLPNTLDTTVWQAPTAKDPRSFISTGDIAAMWLRDSQNQVYPYMRFAKAEPDGIGALIKGLIKRHVDSVLLDPYANSFDYFDTKEACVRCNPGAWTTDNTTIRDPNTNKRRSGMQVGIHQRKWEMDSLSSVLKLGRLYFAATADATPFDEDWRDAVKSIIST
jgi:hypothetical protein